MTTRREFMRLGALFAGAGIAGIGAAEAMEPIARKGGAAMKVGCAAYSYRKYIQAKENPITQEDFIDIAGEAGCDGVEIAGFMMQEPVATESLIRLKKRAFLQGMDICCVSIHNNFNLPPGEQRDKQIALTKEWISRAADIGAPCIRIFANNTPKGRTTEEAIRWVAECVDECAEACAAKGVMLALENHGGFTNTADVVLGIVKAVKSEWFGMNLDTGNFTTADPYADIARTAPYTITTHVKTEVRPGGKTKVPVDLARVVSILKEAGYRGYLVLEYEAAEDAKIAVPRYIKELKALTA